MCQDSSWSAVNGEKASFPSSIWSQSNSFLVYWNPTNSTLDNHTIYSPSQGVSAIEDDCEDFDLEFHTKATLRQLAIEDLSPSPSSSRQSFSSSPTRFDCYSTSRESEDMTSVFIGRLPFDLSQREFEEALKSFHPIECCICMNKRKKSKGFGFANFESESNARRFVELVNDSFLFPSQKLPLRVEVCRRN